VAQELHKQVVLVVQVAEVIEVQQVVQEHQDKEMQVVQLQLEKLGVAEEQVQ